MRDSLKAEARAEVLAELAGKERVKQREHEAETQRLEAQARTSEEKRRVLVAELAREKANANNGEMVAQKCANILNILAPAVAVIRGESSLPSTGLGSHVVPQPTAVHVADVFCWNCGAKSKKCASFCRCIYLTHT